MDYSYIYNHIKNLHREPSQKTEHLLKVFHIDIATASRFDSYRFICLVMDYLCTERFDYLKREPFLNTLEAILDHYDNDVDIDNYYGIDIIRYLRELAACDKERREPYLGLTLLTQTIAYHLYRYPDEYQIESHPFCISMLDRYCYEGGCNITIPAGTLRRIFFAAAGNDDIRGMLVSLWEKVKDANKEVISPKPVIEEEEIDFVIDEISDYGDLAAGDEVEEPELNLLVFDDHSAAFHYYLWHQEDFENYQAFCGLYRIQGYRRRSISIPDNLLKNLKELENVPQIPTKVIYDYNFSLFSFLSSFFRWIRKRLGR